MLRRQRRQHPGRCRRWPTALNAKWKGDPAGARIFSPRVLQLRRRSRQFEQESLGIHEKMEGCTTTTTSPRSSPCTIRTRVRMPERMKAGKFVINGISLAPIEKTVENGEKIVAFRTGKNRAAAIRKALAEG